MFFFRKAVLIFFCLLPLISVADTILFVSPLRVVIKSEEKSAVVGVTNKSDKTRKYLISFIDQKMNSHGTTEIVETFPYSAKRMLKFMPRSVMLEPGQRQVVRLMVRRPSTLPDGDYHTHMLFEEEPMNNEEKEQVKMQKGSFAMDIGAVYGVGIPIVVQQGNVHGIVSFKEAVVVKGISPKPNMLEVGVKHEGNGEAFSHLEAFYVDSTGQHLEKAINARNLRLYREVEDAKIRIPMLSQKSDSKAEELELVFKKGPSQQAEVIRRVKIVLPQ